MIGEQKYVQQKIMTENCVHTAREEGEKNKIKVLILFFPPIFIHAYVSKEEKFTEHGGYILRSSWYVYYARLYIGKQY